MIKAIIILSLSVSVFFGAQQANAQSIKEIDSKLADYLDKISFYAGNPGIDPGKKLDTLININKRMDAYLKQVCIAVPATITANFPKAKEKGLNYVTADDKKIRFYSWDTKSSGGTMQILFDVAQYRTGEQVKVVDIEDIDGYGGDPGVKYAAVKTLKNKENNTIYLVVDMPRGTDGSITGGVIAYTIAHDSLKTVPMFETKAKTYDYISFNCSNRSYYDMEQSGYKPVIALDKKKQILKVPIVLGETCTRDYLTYKYDGNKFVFDKSAK